jgi:hypothetical protein
MRTLGQVIGVAVLGAFFYHSLAVHNGAPVSLEQASPQVITAALHEQFLVVSVLIAIGLATALVTWRWEIRHGLNRKQRERESAPVVESV